MGGHGPQREKRRRATREARGRAAGHGREGRRCSDRVTGQARCRRRSVGRAGRWRGTVVAGTTAGSGAGDMAARGWVSQPGSVAGRVATGAVSSVATSGVVDCGLLAAGKGAVAGGQDAGQRAVGRGPRGTRDGSGRGGRRTGGHSRGRRCGRSLRDGRRGGDRRGRARGQNVSQRDGRNVGGVQYIGQRGRKRLCLDRSCNGFDGYRRVDGSGNRPGRGQQVGGEVCRQKPRPWRQRASPAVAPWRRGERR